MKSLDELTNAELANVQDGVYAPYKLHDELDRVEDLIAVAPSTDLLEREEILHAILSHERSLDGESE